MICMFFLFDLDLVKFFDFFEFCRLFNVLDMEVYCFYGVGIFIERFYIYKVLFFVDNCYIFFCIDILVDGGLEGCLKGGV